LQSCLKYVGPEGEITYYVTPADAIARVGIDSRLRRAAIRLDSMLGSWFQQCVRPHAPFDTCFGSGPDASLWKHGALPLWLMKIFVSEILAFKVRIYVEQRMLPAQCATQLTCS